MRPYAVIVRLLWPGSHGVSDRRCGWRHRDGRHGRLGNGHRPRQGPSAITGVHALSLPRKLALDTLELLT